MNEIKTQEDYIAYRFNAAKQALDDAVLLFENSRFEGATNRAYYCMFYSVSSLAVRYGFSAKTHQGLITWFHQEFVRTGKFDRQTGKDLTAAFISRGEADYTDFINFDEDVVRELVSRAVNSSKPSKT